MLTAADAQQAKPTNHRRDNMKTNNSHLTEDQLKRAIQSWEERMSYLEDQIRMTPRDDDQIPMLKASLRNAEKYWRENAMLLIFFFGDTNQATAAKL